MTGEELDKRLLTIVAQVFRVKRAELEHRQFYFWTDLGAEQRQMWRLITRTVRELGLLETMYQHRIWPLTEVVKSFLTYGQFYNLIADVIDIKARDAAAAPIADDDIPF